MRWLATLGLAMLLTAGFSTGAVAASPDGRTPETAFQLASGSTGTILGSTGGSFLYYEFGYPGGRVEATLTIDFQPTATALANAIGVNLWQDGKRLNSMSGFGPAPGSNSLRFSSPSSSPILAQVYSYYPASLATFSLSLSGIPLAAATPAPTPTSVAPSQPNAVVPGDGSADHPFTLGDSAAGTLASNRDGSFVYYTAAYPGGGVPYTVRFQFAPIGDDTGNGVFVTIFQGGSQLATAQGIRTAVLGQFPMTFSSDKDGPVLIQVSNYNFAQTIQYEISLTK